MWKPTLSLILILVVLIIATAWSIYGCIRFRTWQRWFFFSSSAIMIVYLCVLPIVELLDLSFVESDIYYAIGFVTIALHLLIERILPYWVWAEVIAEESDVYSTD